MTLDENMSILEKKIAHIDNIKALFLKINFELIEGKKACLMDIMDGALSFLCRKLSEYPRMSIEDIYMMAENAKDEPKNHSLTTGKERGYKRL